MNSTTFNIFHFPGDTVVDFANREFRQIMDRKIPVSLINEQRGTICGVRVNLHDYITDLRIQQQIEEALGKIKINVKYEFQQKTDTPGRK